MNAVTLQPAAGAHGELTGMMIIKNILKLKEKNVKKLLSPIPLMGLILQVLIFAVLKLFLLNQMKKDRLI